MTKICTLLELSLVVKKSYCDLELKSSQQYFNMITARRFTAFHKPLTHRICFSEGSNSNKTVTQLNAMTERSSLKPLPMMPSNRVTIYNFTFN